MKKIYIALFTLAICASSMAQWTVQEAIITKAQGDITIDGVADEADWATAVGSSEWRFIVAAEADLNTGPDDFTAEWKALWSEEGIYVLVDVSVDDIVNVDPGNTGPEWHQDLVEIYFDMNTATLADTGARWGIHPEGHYIQACGPGNGGTDDSLYIAFGDLNRAAPVDADAADVAGVVTASSWTMEMFFSWGFIPGADSVVYTPSLEVEIGFDVDVVDNDGGTTPEEYLCRNIWCADDLGGEPAANADHIGRLTFDPGSGVEDFTSNNSFSVYPMPASNYIYFSQEIEGKLLNLLGQEVMNVSGESAEVSSVKSGLYILKTENFSTRVLIK
jgi:hypothetical protein